PQQHACKEEKVPTSHLYDPKGTPVWNRSHDAMSYCLDINSPLVRAESDCFRLLDGVFSCFTRPAIFRWATTQVGPDGSYCIYLLMMTVVRELVFALTW
uniref:Uncharacterized protein n=1 Tax=Neolamprologus brichardi TaxID=32507 RepID=A0A3Q4HLT7_NEOBR